MVFIDYSGEKCKTILVSSYSGKFRPGQNSVKIFASQKHEDESEKFIPKNSGNANYYSNESPRQVQRKCSSRLFLRNTLL